MGSDNTQYGTYPYNTGIGSNLYSLMGHGTREIIAYFTGDKYIILPFSVSDSGYYSSLLVNLENYYKVYHREERDYTIMEILGGLFGSSLPDNKIERYIETETFKKQLNGNIFTCIFTGKSYKYDTIDDMDNILLDISINLKTNITFITKYTICDILDNIGRKIKSKKDFLLFDALVEYDILGEFTLPDNIINAIKNGLVCMDEVEIERTHSLNAFGFVRYVTMDQKPYKYELNEKESIFIDIENPYSCSRYVEFKYRIK